MKKTKIGQVFLKDTNIKNKICKELKLALKNSKQNTIVEVGLGEGDMTKHLLDEFPNYLFYGVEVDPIYANEIEKKFKGRMKVYNENFLTINLENIKEGILFSNVPYQLTTQFIKRFVETIDKPNFEFIAITIQKEAFERLVNSSSPVFYVFKSFFELKTKVKIQRQCFKPIPNVDSMFSIWERKSCVFEKNPKQFLDALYYINDKKNKTIKNNLINNKKVYLVNPNNVLLNKRFVELSKIEKNNLIQEVMKNDLDTNNHNKIG